MSDLIITAAGKPLRLGRELGRGGEGSVYEVPALSGQVAKVYHRPPESKKQAKLAFMAAHADPRLLSVSAWPQETLHQSQTGDVVGFLMPNVGGRDPIHTVYSPAQRKQTRPRATWEFLLWVARNTAAAFEALHSLGYVLGDVNQGNVLVGNDSKVVLIDCDSIQVNAQGQLHLCEVGVAHFTPPELQGNTSFDKIARTPNHDCFGLALMIFHLLFGGRHPFSGVGLRQGVGDSLEEDIQAFHYAYARDARNRGTSPPPKSIPIELVPDAMQAMFQASFTEMGAKGGRPSASHWVKLLDEQRKHLRKCVYSTLHVYPDHLTKCPWCVMEAHSVFYFLDLTGAATSSAGIFDLAQVWEGIKAVGVPPAVHLPDVESLVLNAHPLPDGVPTLSRLTLYRISAIVAALLCSFIPDVGIWFGLCFATVGVITVNGRAGKRRAEEKTIRLTAQEAAQNAFDELCAKAKAECSRAEFVKKRLELEALRDQHPKLAAELGQELSQLQASAESRQRNAYLSRCYIETADIPGVGEGRKANLRSFGIETAADVDQERVEQVRGFGENLTRAVVDWRARCERQFKFDPNLAATEADKAAIRSKFAMRRVQMEAQLRNGKADLESVRSSIVNRVAQFDPLLRDAAFDLAQANADVRVCET